MTKISLVLSRGGQETVHSISAEKTLLGRDESCDIVLNDIAVSRKHAVIICRFEKVYIENVSPSGQIMKSGQPTEYAELDENTEVSIGPYIIFWQTADASNSSEVSKELDEAPSSSSEEEQLMDSPIPEDDYDEVGIVPYDPEASDNDDIVENEAEVLSASHEVSDYPDQDFAMSVPEDDAANFPMNSDEATQVTERGASPKLRLVKGESEQREIKLDIGSAWVIGRSKKAHVQIDSKKISRQHFKIIKIGEKYRLQDMGSSAGTKLNGVTVADAPLQPFDTIQAGAVEIQFLLVDSSFEHLPIANLAQGGANVQALPHFGDDQGNNSTVVNMPVPYSPNENTHAGPSGLYTEDNDFNAGADDEEDPEENWDPSEKVSLVIKFRRKRKKLAKEWNNLPKNKRILYSSLLLGIVLMAALSGETTPESKLASTPSNNTTQLNINENIAQSPDVSPTFYALSLDSQNKIRKLYQEAEIASEKKRWKSAFEASSKILESVDKYKRTKEIMLQAQSVLNQNLIEKLSPGIDDARTQAKANEERIQILLDSGTNYLRKSKWGPAEEAFVSVLNLDPTNKEAEHGLVAARKKDPMAINDGNSAEESLVKLDPEFEAKQKEEEYIQTFESRYNDANRLVLESQYDLAVPILEDLYGNLTVALDEYQAGRGPASVRPQYIDIVRGLQSKTQESYSQIEQNLSIEYQTQIADAEQYLTNRQYVMARKAYDKILQRTPYFTEVRRLRDNLYAKIITEAKNLYRGALIYESIGNVNAATSNLQKSFELLSDVKDSEALKYLQKTETKLSHLQN